MVHVSSHWLVGQSCLFTNEVFGLLGDMNDCSLVFRRVSCCPVPNVRNCYLSFGKNMEERWLCWGNLCAASALWYKQVAET